MKILTFSAVVAIVCAGVMAAGCDMERRDRANQAPTGSGANPQEPANQQPGQNPAAPR